MCIILWVEFNLSLFVVKMGFLYDRMTKLLDDEVEEDELFWNQEALKDVCCFLQ